MTKPPSHIEIPGFHYIRRIEKGGMTDLYVVADDVRQLFVIRTIKEEYRRNRLLRKQFLRSIEVLKQLEHEGICQYVDSGKHKGRPYLVIPFYPSDNLREMLTAKNEALHHHPITLMKQLGDALRYVHHAGFLHMDLKPENILVTRDGRLILVDFDLSIRHKNKMVRLRKLPGTPNYLAPETLLHRKAGMASEVFVFGIIAYEILTGKRPFKGNTPKEYRQSVISQDPQRGPIPIQAFRPDIPEALSTLIIKCLAKTPEARYPSVGVFLKELERIS